MLTYGPINNDLLSLNVRDCLDKCGALSVSIITLWLRIFILNLFLKGALSMMGKQYVALSNLAHTNPCFSEYMLRRMRAEGRLPGFYSGTRYYVDVEAFEAQIASECKANAPKAVINA